MQINAIRRIQIDAMTKGVDDATAKLNKLAGAQDHLAVASDKSTKAQLSMERALERMQRQYDQAYRAQQALAKVERDLAGARAQGLVSQQRASELMQLAIRHHNSGGQAAMAHGRAMQLLQSQAVAMTGSLGAASTVLSGLGPAGLAVGAALAAATLGLKQAAEASLRLAESAGRLQDFAETTGFTVAQLQVLEHAGAKVGVSSQSMTTTLERFSVAMGDSCWGKVGVLARNRALLERMRAALQQRQVPAVIAQRRDEFLSPEFRWLVASLTQIVRPLDRRNFPILVEAFNRVAGIDLPPDQLTADAEATGRGYFATWHEAANNASQASSKAPLLEMIDGVAKESGASKATLDRILNEFTVADRGDGSQSDLAEDLSAWREISREISRHLGGNVTLDQFLQELQLRSKAPSPETFHGHANDRPRRKRA